MATIDQTIGIIFSHPLTYILIIFIGLYLILRELNKGKLKPEQKPDFGVKYRAARVKKALEKREKAFAIKPKKAYLYRDIFRIGKITSIELIPLKYGNPKVVKEEMLYSIVYRGFGLWNAIKSSLGFSKNRILVDDTTIQRVFSNPKKEIHYTINNNILMRERGGVLIASKDGEKRFIDEINADLDYENAKGFVSDFPRRLSNLHPSQAMKTEQMELEEGLEAKAENRKRFFWSKGG